MPPFGRSDAEWADVAAFYRCSGTSVIVIGYSNIFKAFIVSIFARNWLEFCSRKAWTFKAF